MLGPPACAVHAALCVTGREGVRPWGLERVSAGTALFIYFSLFLLPRGNARATEGTEHGHFRGDMSLSSPRPCKLTRPAPCHPTSHPIRTFLPPQHPPPPSPCPLPQYTLPSTSTAAASTLINPNYRYRNPTSPIVPPPPPDPGSPPRTLSAILSSRGSPVPPAETPFFLSPGVELTQFFFSFFLRIYPPFAILSILGCRISAPFVLTFSARSGKC